MIRNTITMAARLLKVILLCVLGLSDGSDVTQTPLLWKEQGQSAMMDCNHTKGAAFYQMYWFRQLPEETIKQVVFTTANSKPDYERGFSEEKHAVTKPDAFSGTFTVKNLVPEDNGLYFCAVSRQVSYNEAYFGAGTKLTVLEPGHDITPPERVSVFKPKGCKNKKVTLVCVASGFYPDHVTVSWKINQDKDTENVATDAIALREGKYYSITSRLKVTDSMWFTRSNKFTCVVDFFNGTATKSYYGSIYGEEVKRTNLATGIRRVTRDEYVRVMQMAKLSYCVCIFKSCIYGGFVAFLVLNHQRFAGKQCD